MNASATALGIDRLSVADRLSPLEEIWDSLIDEDDPLPVPASHVEELDRRLASREANPEAGSSWEDVKARLKAASEDDR